MGPGLRVPRIRESGSAGRSHLVIPGGREPDLSPPQFANRPSIGLSSGKAGTAASKRSPAPRCVIT